MLETEFVRSLQSNYERVRLKEQPDEQRYQYCILTRGGIRGLLPCSLRYINGEAYLYYDITSRQNVAQLYGKQVIDRAWIKDFFWSYEQVTGELGRFLLDERNILVYPEQIFEDLGSRSFIFLYLPYNEEGNGFDRFLEFLLEHMDYEDNELVECMYFLYEQFEKYGEVYLQGQIFTDISKLELEREDGTAYVPENGSREQEITEDEILMLRDPIVTAVKEAEEIPAKKSFLERLGLVKKRKMFSKPTYDSSKSLQVTGYAVAEQAEYEEEDYGRTIYVEHIDHSGVHKLYTPDGRVVATLDKEVFIIGKQKEEVDLTLEGDTISRLHARICKEGDFIYLEDLNATNGTFKNGLRLQPYEKRRLEEGDEIQFGKLLFIYR